MSLPEITETAVNTPYWQALREGRLDYQHCKACGHNWLPARSNCPECLADDTDWRPASGIATLISWVVYHKAYAPHLADQLPYNVAVVELVEGPRLLSNILDRPDGQGLEAGAALTLVIGTALGRAIPCFRLSEN
ncbi:OB-fold domain-containing protein [Paracoccus sp. AS002]|uniref:Zn-ribbon domain-containing OB-fold protein n=1 Tax=Paracoccus sp. AS002 TaxID=3019545 RepID=UPI0023E8B869|nr:OB-fold domain-containing protein [Paracoccus sp. AS002]MDF3907568.1 OB-fold domain-containing protein [Paracoccus sp. AS002]